MNIKETATNYEIEVAVPGMTKKDFKVQLDGNTLTISSEKTSETEEKDKVRYTSREFSHQSFSRTFNLQKRRLIPKTSRQNMKMVFCTC